MNVYLSKCRGLSLSRHELSNVAVYSPVNTECVHSSLSIGELLIQVNSKRGESKSRVVRSDAISESSPSGVTSCQQVLQAGQAA